MLMNAKKRFGTTGRVQVTQLPEANEVTEFSTEVTSLAEASGF